MGAAALAMRMRAALVLVVLIAGCAAPTADVRDPVPAPQLAPFVGEPIVQDHDHADRAAHNASQGLRLVAHVKPWGDGSEYGAGGVNEFAIRGQYVFVSRSNPEGGFAVVDLSDPRAPRVVGDFRSEGGGDIEVTSDGRFVLLMTQRTLPGQQTLDAATPLARAPRGVYVVDVSDPTRPALSSFFPLPTNGPHTAFYYRDRSGQEIVALQTYDLVTDPTSGALEATNPGTQRIWLTELVRDATGARLEPRGEYAVTSLPPSGQLYFPHDAYIERHPVTGARLMYVAYWDAGVRIVDITDLARPVEVAAHADFAPSALIAMHDVRPFPAPIAGRHVLAAGPEIVTAPEAGQVTFIDTTDPSAPEKLGHWSVPGNLTVDSPFLFSPHVFDLDARGRLVIGYNHAGVWLVDASDPANATTLGFYLPHEERPGFSGTQPSVWGARFYRGYVLATDGPTGLYVLETEQGPLPGNPPGVAGAAWPTLPLQVLPEGSA